SLEAKLDRSKAATEAELYKDLGKHMESFGLGAERAAKSAAELSEMMDKQSKAYGDNIEAVEKLSAEFSNLTQLMTGQMTQEEFNASQDKLMQRNTRIDNMRARGFHGTQPIATKPRK